MDTIAATEIVDRYIACWNAEDPSDRADLVGRTWTAEARSVDPLADVSGRAVLPLVNVLQQYADAWRVGDPERVFPFYADDMVLHLLGRLTCATDPRPQLDRHQQLIDRYHRSTP